MRSGLIAACACSLVGILGFGGAVASAKTIGMGMQQDTPPAKPGDTPAAKQKPKTNKDNATESAPDQPNWNPERAQKDLEVGQYYMHKGDVDAAIDRFQDATTAKPGYALPFRYLGEAQEKKGLKKQAIKSYRRYMDLAPHAEDAEKIQKKIDKLQKEVDKEARKG